MGWSDEFLEYHCHLRFVVNVVVVVVVVYYWSPQISILLLL